MCWGEGGVPAIFLGSYVPMERFFDWEEGKFKTTRKEWRGKKKSL
jgi:hypothetical protein